MKRASFNEPPRSSRGLLTYADEVVLGEAAGGDVVLQQLLGEVLVHLGGLVGVHGVPQGLVQVCKHSAHTFIPPHLQNGDFSASSGTERYSGTQTGPLGSRRA